MIKSTTIKNFIATTIIAAAVMLIPGMNANAKTYTGQAGDNSTWNYNTTSGTWFPPRGNESLMRQIILMSLSNLELQKLAMRHLVVDH